MVERIEEARRRPNKGRGAGVLRRMACTPVIALKRRVAFQIASPFPPNSHLLNPYPAFSIRDGDDQNGHISGQIPLSRDAASINHELFKVQRL